MSNVEERFRDPKFLYDIKSFYDNGAVLKASFQGMRYQVERVVADEEKHLKATIWPEPFCFEKTADEKKESKEFAYSDEGLLALHQWLCDSYDTKKEKWEHARDFPLDGIMSQQVAGDFLLDGIVPDDLLKIFRQRTLRHNN